MLLAFLTITAIAKTQTLPDYESIKLEVKSDYNENANNAALQAANHLLGTPLEKDDIARLRSAQYLIKWMTGSPDYTFALDEQATRFTKKNSDLLILYMAAMSKYVLENKTDAADAVKVKINSLKLIAQYAKDPKNKVKQTSELKKLIEADEKGELNAYLKL